MGFHIVSCNVKIEAINLFIHELLPLHTILDVCGFSEKTWYCVMKLWCDTGNAINPKPSLQELVRYLNYKDGQHLLCLVQQNSNYFLDELLHMFKMNHFISVHYVTMYQGLECASRRTKKLKRITQERDEPCRADFIE